MNHAVRLKIEAGAALIDCIKSSSCSNNRLSGDSILSYDSKVCDTSNRSEQIISDKNNALMFSGLNHLEIINLLAFAIHTNNLVLTEHLTFKLTKVGFRHSLTRHYMLIFISIVIDELLSSQSCQDFELIKLHLDLRMNILGIMDSLEKNNQQIAFSELNYLVKCKLCISTSYIGSSSSEIYESIDSNIIDLERCKSYRDVILHQQMRPRNIAKKSENSVLIIDDMKFSQSLCALRQSRISSYNKVMNLNEVALSCFSQFGEDGIIDYLMNILDIEKPSFLEIGTGDYTESNTRFLYKKTLGTGIIIDGDQFLIPKTKSLLKQDYWRGSLHPFGKFITINNILPLLLGGVRQENLFVNLLSIDIDGNDYWILKTILPFIKADIIITEYNPFFGNQDSLTIPYDPKFNRFEYHYSGMCFGASIKGFYGLLTRYGYKLIGANSFKNNAFWLNQKNLSKYKLKIYQEDDLEFFTDCRSRESRDINGKLSYSEGKYTFEKISNCDIYDLESDFIRKLSIVKNK